MLTHACIKHAQSLEHISNTCTDAKFTHMTLGVIWVILIQYNRAQGQPSCFTGVDARTQLFPTIFWSMMFQKRLFFTMFEQKAKQG